MIRSLFIFFCLAFLATGAVRGGTIIIGTGFRDTLLLDTHNWKARQKSGDIRQQFTITNRQAERAFLYLCFNHPGIDEITVDVKRDDVTQIYRLGDRLPFRSRALKHYDLVQPLELDADETATLNIRVYGQFEPLNFEIRLLKQNTFIKRTNHDNLFTGAFYGIFFMFLLLLICFYIFSRNKFFLLYFIISGTTVLLFMLYNGTGYQYVWFYSPSLQQLLPPVLASSYLAAHAYFIRSFFRADTRYIHFNRLVSVYLILAAGIILFTLLQFLAGDAVRRMALSDHYWFMCALFISYGVLVLGISALTYLNTRKREALWIFIGGSIQFLNWIVFIENIYGSFALTRWIAGIGLFPSLLFVPHISYLLIGAEIFVISYFITVNYHTLIRQNDISARRLNFLQQRNINTFILGQEETREQITRRIDEGILRDIRHIEERSRALISAGQPERLVSVIRDLQHTISDLNNITGNYVTPDMQQIDLHTLLQTALDKLGLEKDIHYHLADNSRGLTLNAHANTHLYRVLQEVSNNIIKHARAERVDVELYLRGKVLVIGIRDDGVGMSAAPGDKGIGLINIESRIRSLSGSFRIESADGTGTAYIFELPLKDIS